VLLMEAVAACEAAEANTQAGRDAQHALTVALQHTLDATGECERLGADIVRAAAESELPQGECKTGTPHHRQCQCHRMCHKVHDTTCVVAMLTDPSLHTGVTPPQLEAAARAVHEYAVHLNTLGELWRVGMTCQAETEGC
jgi:hypothetical protein